MVQERHHFLERVCVAAVMRNGKLMAHASPRELVTKPGSDYVASLMAMPSRQAKIFAELAERDDA